MSTPFHSKYYACELARRWASDNAEKLSHSLNNATIDLNPHQIDAALFAFRSPLSRGALLADEVGLGKTIEAGLVISQLWAERKRRILCIMPAALRQQWERELAEKFFIDSLILESANHKLLAAQGQAKPFEQMDKVVLCSFEFAKREAAAIQAIPWNLVVIDEAHRLRNVYKTGSKIARAIREAIGNRPKILLTATPLQNSLMELYGLISFIDPHLFGSDDSFRSQFARKADDASNDEFVDLRRRILPVCQRTLRRQVQEYIRYTNRVSLTKDFTPTDQEWQLYETVSTYLQRPQSFALPVGQRALMTLVLRKILASSSFAIAATLETLIQRLEAKQGELKPVDGDVSKGPEADYEAFAETQEEWNEEAPNGAAAAAPPEDSNAAARAAIELELGDLRNFKKLAESITRNAKGDALLVALKAGFESAAKLGAKRKALIFTESRRTQTYLKDLLSNNGYAGQIVTFNGTNNDPDSNAIYQEWLRRHEGQDCVTGSRSADARSALVEEFRDRASIMIATESGAEGINLQFCNLVVNYDMPWNPQRIEQRIGRCHRYGQKYDVVVVNFLNRDNAADVRVYQLLNEKFRLFDGVFGASDEVIGAIGSGVDFEKRIVSIYQQCRSPEQIQFEFDRLQQELESEITEARSVAQEQLLNNFDQEVIEKVRVQVGESRNRFEDLLWRATRFFLDPYARFDSVGRSFELVQNPFPAETIHAGPYRMGRNVEDANTYRIGHPLAQRVLERCLALETPPTELNFHLTDSGKRIAILEPHVGHSGWLLCSKFSVEAFDAEDHMLFAGLRDDGATLDPDACRRLFDLPATVGQPILSPSIPTLAEQLADQQKHILEDVKGRNAQWLDQEATKLDHWSEDLKYGLEQEIRDLDLQIREAKRASIAAESLADKLTYQKLIKSLQTQRTERRRDFFGAQDEIDTRRDRLIEDIQDRLSQKQRCEDLFLIRWQLS